MWFEYDWIGIQAEWADTSFAQVTGRVDEWLGDRGGTNGCPVDFICSIIVRHGREPSALVDHLCQANINELNMASLDGSDCQSCFMMATSVLGRGLSV